MKYNNAELESVRNEDMSYFLERHEGFHFKAVGSYLESVEHDSLKIYPDRHEWHWYSRDLYGIGTIDWLMKVDGCSFSQAAEYLLGAKLVNNTAGRTSARDSPDTNYRQPELPKPFLPPEAFKGRLRELYAYLCQSRGLPKEIVDFCVKNKLIYQDMKKRVIFCGYDREGKMRFAEAKITNTFNKYYPQNISGSQKRYSFFIPADPKAFGCDPTQLYVFEAPIDLLSHGALMQEGYIEKCRRTGSQPDGGYWRRVNRLSLSGLSDNAINQRISDNPQINKIALCLDADDKGLSAAKRLLSKLGGKADVRILLPPCGKDWNEALMQRKSFPLKKTTKMKI